MTDPVRVREWGADRWSVMEPERKCSGSDPDGLTAWVERRRDRLGDYYWWCTWHRSALCSDVDVVKQVLRQRDELNKGG